jgi:hypothetical protein
LGKSLLNYPQVAKHLPRTCFPPIPQFHFAALPEKGFLSPSSPAKNTNRHFWQQLDKEFVAIDISSQEFVAKSQ